MAGPIPNLPVSLGLQGDAKDPLQREFLRLLGEIEEFKRNSGALDEAMTRARARYTQEIQPLVDKLAQARLALLPPLSDAYVNFQLRGGEKKKLAEVIRCVICDLRDRFGQDDETLIRQHLATLPGTEEHMESRFDEDDGDDERIHGGKKGEDGETYIGEDEDAGDGEAVSGENPQGNRQDTETSKRRGRSPKQAHGADIHAELRALYLKLSKDLHPDRERDPQKRLEKTEWMQKVTRAYQEKDLFALLEILARNPFNSGDDAQSLGALTAKTLRRFVKQLREQRQALKMETVARMLGFGEFQFFGKFLRGQELNPKAFQKTRKDIKAEMEHARKLNATYRDAEALREYLKMVGRYPLESLV